MLAFIGFVLLHIGIAATMTVGLFSYAAIAVWMAVLPSEFWDRFAAFRLPSSSMRLPEQLAASPTDRPNVSPRPFASRRWPSWSTGTSRTQISATPLNSFDRGDARRRVT